MREWLKISQHKHSGRHLPHEHTSYLPLGLLVLIVGLTMASCAAPNLSEASPGPAAGSVGLTGTVPKAPPKVGATITSPTNGQHFSTSPITVSGGCTAKTLIEVYKNDIFAGHTYHKPGTYQITRQASDSQGRVAFLTVAAIVNGKPAVAAASTGSNNPANKLLVLWPVLASAATIVVSFWLGERREKKILQPLGHPL
jgi:hypothetical protein